MSGHAAEPPCRRHRADGDNGGYWLVASDGGIFNFGDAGFFGSAGGLTLNKPIVGIAPTADGGGYWLVATDGGSSTTGTRRSTAPPAASTSTSPSWAWPRRPTAGATGWWPPTAASSPTATPSSTARPGACTSTSRSWAWQPTPDGGGYWLVASDGGIFAYGDAQFYGSTGGIHLDQPIVGMAAMPDGAGYWFTAADGGLFDYGTAPFLGAAAGTGIGTVVGMATDGARRCRPSSTSPALRSTRRTARSCIRPRRRPPRRWLLTRHAAASQELTPSRRNRADGLALDLDGSASGSEPGGRDDGPVEVGPRHAAVIGRRHRSCRRRQVPRRPSSPRRRTCRRWTWRGRRALNRWPGASRRLRRPRRSRPAPLLKRIWYPSPSGVATAEVTVPWPGAPKYGASPNV